MSKANRRITATVIACLAVGLVFLARARAEDPDLLKDSAARQKVLAEQAERDIRDARDEAYKTARVQPSQALERIRKLLLSVDNNPYFTDEKRDALTALLKRDLVEIQKIADGASNPNAGTGFHPVPRDAGTTDDQKKLIDSALSHFTSTKDALAESADVRAKKAEAIRGLLAQVDKASIPPSGEYVFPSPEEWIRLSKMRSKNNQLTETERAILKALAKTVSVDFKDQRLGGVIDWFQHQTGQTIVLDTPALSDVGVNSESTNVNVTLNKVSTRTALKKVLADLGLTYVIKDETIFVTTPTRAKDMMTIRTYYIGDLMGQYDVRFGGAMSQYQAMAAVAQLVQMIQSNIDPESWELNGKEGGGTIVFDPIHMTLVVKQSAEIHYKMMEGLIP